MKNVFCCLLAVVGFGVVALAEGEDKELVHEEGSKAWHFRIGPVMAPRVRTHITTPRMVLPKIPQNGSTASGLGTGTLPADPSAGYVERRYIDGYVKPDEGTGDPMAVEPDRTWDWGAANVPAQYSGGKMSYHTDMTRWTESYSSSSFRQGGGSECDRDVLLGVEAMGGWTFWADQRFDAAIDVGFRYYGSGDQNACSRCGNSVTTSRNEYRYVDRYDASHWTTIPGGQYIGAPDRGRLLGAQPTREEELAKSTESYSSYACYNSTRLDYNIWDLRLGPTFGWHATDWLSLRGGVYGLIGLVDAELNSDTYSSVGGYHADSSKCTPVFGMAFAFNAQVNLTERLFLYGGIEYDWWTDQVSMDAGGSHATLQLSDFSVSTGIGFEF